MLKTYRNIGKELSRNIVYKVLKGTDTVTRTNVVNKSTMEAGQNTGMEKRELFDQWFRGYIMCASSKLGDGSVCGP